MPRLKNEDETDITSEAGTWQKAREAVLVASALPVGNPDFRDKLNALADAEDKLYRAIKKFMNRE